MHVDLFVVCFSGKPRTTGDFKRFRLLGTGPPWTHMCVCSFYLPGELPCRAEPGCLGPRDPGSLSCPLSVQAASLASCEGTLLPSCCLGSGQTQDTGVSLFPSREFLSQLLFPFSWLWGPSLSLPCGLLCGLESLSPPARPLLDPDPSTHSSFSSSPLLPFPASLSPHPLGSLCSECPFLPPPTCLLSVPLMLSACQDQHRPQN